MFDVDGTLVRGNGIDDICFSEAIRDVLKVGQFDTDWSQYSNVSDSGITSEVIEKHCMRRATEVDITSVRQSYLSKLKDAVEKDANIFQATPGAKELIADLISIDGVSVAVATGGWRDSALLKLETVGIPFDNIPIASSDDAHERELIMRKSHDSALAYANCTEFQSVLYVGDHPWDFVNSTKLGYRFLGIGFGSQEHKLKQAGVTHIMPDLTDKDYFFKILFQALCIEGAQT